MSEAQAPVSWNQLAGFGGVVDNYETAFADTVGGAGFEVGVHKDVTIDVVELKKSKAENFYLKLQLGGPAGEKISTNIMLSPGKDGKGFHFTYTKAAAAIVSDAELRMRTFGKLFATNPALLDSLRGLKVNIQVAKGKTGYVVEENALGAKVVIDVATGKSYPEFEGRTFEGYSDIKDACKEYAIKRMYNEVTSVLRPSDEAVAENEQALSEVLRTAEAATAGKTTTGSRAARPRASI